MMALRYYPALLDRAEDGTVGVVFPDLPGCTSGGATIQEAAANAAEALALHVLGALEDGEPLPEPSALDAPLPDWLEGSAGNMRALVPIEMPTKPNRIVRLNVTLPEDVVQAIDRVSSNRSRFLAEAAREKLRAA